MKQLEKDNYSGGISEVKRYLKVMAGSKYMLDRRNQHKDEQIPLTPVFYQKDETSGYKPLGQILLERNIISLPQLEEALKTHWRKGVVLGEVLKELGVLTQEKLAEALWLQESAGSGAFSG